MPQNEIGLEMSTPVKLTVFTPLLNAGRDLSPFEIPGGPRIDLSFPNELRTPLQQVATEAHVSRWEAEHFVAARGWLWVQRVDDRIDEQLWDYIQTYRLAEELQVFLACAQLVGCGENDYWRTAGQIEACGIYRVWQDEKQMRVLPPIRFNFRFGHPAASDFEPQWNREKLEIAGELHPVVRQFEGANMPRLWMAFRIWNVLCTLLPAQVFIRFQLAISALETFYIRPEMKKDIWDVNERAEAICKKEGVLTLGTAFWARLRDLRNHITHRGGLPLAAATTPEDHRTLLNTEQLLRATIRWAFKNQSDAARALDNDDWPTA
jgi:hypothetical protein